MKIEYSLMAKAQPEVLQAVLQEEQVQLTAIPDLSGKTFVTVIAKVGRKQAEQRFEILVNPVDAPPTLANPLADQVLNIGAAPLKLDLALVFADIDSDLEKAQYEVVPAEGQTQPS